MTKATDSFLLLVGDDGTLLLPPFFIKESMPLFAAPHDAHTMQAILDDIAAAPHIPVTILADTQALHIKHEELPPLSRGDRRSLLTKRLEQAFEGSDLKSALPKKNNTALLVAAEETGALGDWIQKLEGLANPSGGVCLLPVESADMLPALMPQAAEGWALLLSYHKSSGFRQIVTRDGELVFTRLTMPCALTDSKGFIASSLGMEIKATRDYLARFGLTSDQPLALTVLVPAALHEVLSVTPMDVTTRLILTPHDAAVRLKLPFAPAPDDERAEMVHALWAAHKPRLKVVLMKQAVRHHRGQLLIRRCGFLLATIVCALAVISFGVKMIEPLRLRADLAQVRTDITALEQETQQAKATLAQETEPLVLLRKAAERRRLFANEPPEIMQMLADVAPVLADQARLTKLDWANQTLTLVVKLTHADSAPQQFEALLRAMRAALPAATVTMATTNGAPPQGIITNAKPDDTPPPPSAQFTVRRGAP